jgi:hypothetical protein
MGYLTLAVFASLMVAAPLAAQDLDPAAPVVSSAAPVVPENGYTAMSDHERWHLYLHENLLSTRFGVEVLGSALISHISRDPKEWGLGFRGYFRRVQNRFVTASVDGAVHSSLAAVLHEDTRYWRYHGSKNGLRRAGHALARTFVTYNDAGERVPDFASMAGIYTGSVVSTYWHPRSSVPFMRGVQAGNAAVLGQAGANLFKEFGPDLKHLFARK